MARSIGVLATRYIWVGMVEGTKLGTVRMYPEPGQVEIDLKSLPADAIIAKILEQVEQLHEGERVDSVGAGFPGIVRNGVIDESPNLAQLKGLRIQERLAAALKSAGFPESSHLRRKALDDGVEKFLLVRQRLFLGDFQSFIRAPAVDQGRDEFCDRIAQHRIECGSEKRINPAFQMHQSGGCIRHPIQERRTGIRFGYGLIRV